jgi:hypothetical protein
VEKSEIVLVDDGPRARTGEIMAKAASKDSRVVAVCLMRNHDHQLAPTRGLTLCRREPILIIEADLQDPPESPARNDAAHGPRRRCGDGQRRRRDGDSMFKRITAAVFWRLIDPMTDIDLPCDAGREPRVASSPRPWPPTARRCER